MSESDISAQHTSSAVLRYGLAVSSVAAALILTLLLRPDALVAPIFFLAIILTAWFSGFGPGLFAALLSTLALAYFFLHPMNSLRFGEIPHLLVFFVSAFLVSSWSAGRRRAETLLGEGVMNWKPKFKSEQQTSGRATSNYRPRSPNAGAWKRFYASGPGYSTSRTTPSSCATWMT